MIKKMGWLVALTLCCAAGAMAAIVISWDGIGPLRAEGLEPGDSCSLEWTTSLSSGFSSGIPEYEGLVADDDGRISVDISTSEYPAMFFRLNVVESYVPSNTPPEGMVEIPALAPFYMDETEVTLTKWFEVYNWAVTNGYNFSNSGDGKYGYHPVHTVNWYDCIKWCNARSEMEGLTPHYTVSSNVYRALEYEPDRDFDADGYRLPTESQWEFAARGGLSGKRFPWGDTISFTNANYYSYWDAGVPYYTYDLAWQEGYHPYFIYVEGEYPYTSPVKYFAANGYGLYDMAGNVSEWCWDNETSSLDSYAYTKGGCWDYTAYRAQIDVTYYDYKDSVYDDTGFRTVLPVD
ncbi:MAG: SUMF1/EgtB/PvdO family nonheme iron enzyme [Pontiellaceae bacterium]|nr:SUMF1/EgtB/PvdO family nonheme iron enzyme [Pontiellaceae bacterium]MBN2784935.1 SUMF1/EgtB/PvdO family nonheme iron enzyme [Pontiellaceae bacterium]